MKITKKKKARESKLKLRLFWKGFFSLTMAGLLIACRSSDVTELNPAVCNERSGWLVYSSPLGSLEITALPN